MNERFNSALKSSGKTIYRLAKDTGIPYTNLSELANEKKSINTSSAIMVSKIAFALNTSVEQLLDVTSMMDGVSGKYRGVRYLCEYDGTQMQVHLKDKERELTKAAGIMMNGSESRQTYEWVIEILIDRYLADQEMEERLRKAMEVYRCQSSTH